jgi:hypothetical protein
MSSMTSSQIQEMVNQIARLLIAKGSAAPEVEAIIVMEARRISDEMYRGCFK